VVPLRCGTRGVFAAVARLRSSSRKGAPDRRRPWARYRHVGAWLSHAVALALWAWLPTASGPPIAMPNGSNMAATNSPFVHRGDESWWQFAIVS